MQKSSSILKPSLTLKPIFTLKTIMPLKSAMPLNPNQILNPIMILLLNISSLSQPCRAQTITINYFGQKPPTDTAQKFAPGTISKEGRYELMSAYSSDGKEFCFTVTNEQWSHFEIWHTLFRNGKWAEPSLIHLPEIRDAFGPAFSPDNQTLYFTEGNWVTHPSTISYSLRKQDSHKQGSRNQDSSNQDTLNHLPPLNPSDKTSHPYAGNHPNQIDQSPYWSEPIKLDTTINPGSDQWQCSVARDGTLLFSSKRAGGMGNYDLYIAEPDPQGIRKVSNLHELNSPADEYSSYIAPDKSYIIFSSQRKGGYGWDDLYISFRQQENTWTKPLNLGPTINTIHAEFSPQVTPDGKFLLYSKWDAGNKWSHIYWVRIDKIIAQLKKQATTSLITKIPETQ